MHNKFNFKAIYDHMESLKVAIRIRPDEEGEKCVEVNERDSSTVRVQKREKNTISGQTQVKEHSFTFDTVFGPDSRQEDVFEHVRPMIDDAINGYTSTVFAFGMTGSGKTHTISGSANDAGVVPRAIEHIFTALRSQTSNNAAQVAMVLLTYVELYNNNLYDLLDPTATRIDNQKGGNKLRILEDAGNGVHLVGSPGIRTPVGSPQEALELIQKGNKLRSTSATKLNERSSRSHTVISLEIMSQNLDASSSASSIMSSTSAMTIGKVNLVDLAGSERVKMSGARGKTLQEAKQINKALSVLGDVLNSLSKYHRDRERRDKRRTDAAVAAAGVVGDNDDDDDDDDDGDDDDDDDGDDNDDQDGESGIKEGEQEGEGDGVAESGGVGEVEEQQQQQQQEEEEEEGEVDVQVDVPFDLPSPPSPASSSSSGDRPIPPPHIPFRNSKLTMLLKDSLGGRSKTMMVATVRSPKAFYSQSMTALRYAARARHIQNIPVKNTDAGGGDMGGSGASEDMKHSLEEVTRLRARLDERERDFQRICQELAALQKAQRASIALDAAVGAASTSTDAPTSSRAVPSEDQSQEERDYRRRLSEMNVQTQREKSELQEHMRCLIHGHESALAEREEEFGALQLRMRAYEEQVASLQQDRKSHLIYKKEIEFDRAELVADVEGSRRDVETLKKALRDALKELRGLRRHRDEWEKGAAEHARAAAAAVKATADKAAAEEHKRHQKIEEEWQTERGQFVAALQRVSVARARTKAVIQELTEENMRLSSQLSVQGATTEVEAERGEERGEVATGSIAGSTVGDRDVGHCSPTGNNQTEEYDPVAGIASPHNSVNRTDAATPGITTSPLSVSEQEQGQEQTHTDSDSNDAASHTPKTRQIMSLKDRIRGMAENEEDIVGQMQRRLDDLEDARLKLQRLQSNWNSEYSSLSAAQIEGETELDALKHSLFRAEGRIGSLQAELAKERAKVKHLEASLGSQSPQPATIQAVRAAGTWKSNDSPGRDGKSNSDFLKSKESKRLLDMLHTFQKDKSQLK